ncbi:MAG TPA: Crp/Fnr family transcriptional regulator, partial [Saprospiraceae bacterium]|nr:Crp/Fnr family transcriptional regulator [Saprospiraceae bacterium]
MKAAQSITMDILQNFALFEGVEPELLTQLAAQAETLKVGRQQLIYEVGDRSDRVFFLAKGVVKIGTHSEDGREVIKQVLHPLALFGELCLAGEHTRKEFAATMNEEVQLIAIRVQCLQQLMRQNHHLALRALHFIGSRLRRAENRLE